MPEGNGLFSLGHFIKAIINTVAKVKLILKNSSWENVPKIFNMFLTSKLSKKKKKNSTWHFTLGLDFSGSKFILLGSKYISVY